MAGSGLGDAEQVAEGRLYKVCAGVRPGIARGGGVSIGRRERVRETRSARDVHIACTERMRHRSRSLRLRPFADSCGFQFLANLLREKPYDNAAEFNRFE